MALPLAPITNLNGSAIGVINNNSEKLVDEFEKTFYKDGSVNMDGPIDMDSNRIINLPPAVSPSSPVTLEQFLAEKKGDKGEPGLPGVGGNTFLTLSSIKASNPATYASAILASAAGSDGGYANGSFTYQLGNFVGRTDVIKLDAIPLSVGALVPQMAEGVSFKRTSTLSNALPISKTLTAYATLPEQFGAVGDGVTDDSPAINRALAYLQAEATATAGQVRPGQLLLSAGKVYKCGSPVVIDTRYQNVTLYGTLDFSSWTGTYVTIAGGPSPLGNGYGYHGAFEGAGVIKGSGAANNSIGILYESNLAGSSSRLCTKGISITKCGTGVKFGNRGYNQLILNCEIFDCDTGVWWPATTADNDERNNIRDTDIYNCRRAIWHQRPAGCLLLSGCSVDYVERVWDLENGKISSVDTHYEASNWKDRPFNTTAGDASAIFDRGWIVQQPGNAGAVVNFFYCAAGTNTKLRDVRFNNTNEILTPNATTPTTWATGPGRFEMTGGEPAFEFGGFPKRQHSLYSVLSDGEFERALGEDALWIREDTQPITSRYTGTNIQLTQVATNPYDGASCLRFNKQDGVGSVASFILMAIPVRYGDKITSGFRVRAAPDRPGTAQTLVIQGGFAKIDGQSATGTPKIVRFSPPGDMTINPTTSAYSLVTPLNGASQATAPSWATHYIVDVNAFQAANASFLFDGAWVDRW